MDWLIAHLWPLAAGFGCQWFAGRCRGRNARNAFTLAAWGFWLLLLGHLSGFIIWPLNWILLYAPSVLCFLLAANSILKEMRAQQQGEFTDAA